MIYRLLEWVRLQPDSHRPSVARSREEQLHRPHLEDRAHARQRACDLDRLFERLAVHDVEPEQLLLGLGERPVDHVRRVGRAQLDCSRRRHQPYDRAQPALGARSWSCTRRCLSMCASFLLRGHRVDQVFRNVNQDRIEHAAVTSTPKDGAAGAVPTFRHRISGERNSRRRDVFLEVGDRGGAGNRQHRRRARQQPGQRRLRRRDGVLVRDAVQLARAGLRPVCSPAASGE